MTQLGTIIDHRKVALLAEGVDRNTFYLGDKLYRVSRPPRGGRG